MKNSIPELGYDPASLPRERARHYISASEAEIQAMLAAVGKKELADLYAHVPQDARMPARIELPPELPYGELAHCLAEIAEKNIRRSSFLGDGLQQYRVCEIVPHVLGIRRLTTAYTPYQPERSQGTLTTHWIYQCTLAALTGFEAVNASFYDRSTSLFEALKCAQRLSKGANRVLVAGSLYPGDLAVLETHAVETDLELEVLPISNHSGRLDREAVVRALAAGSGAVAAIAFPQVNCFGLLEDVDFLTDAARAQGIRSIAVIDPILLGQGCLKPPREYGSAGQGADMFVAEGQHLAIGPNFGGPGLGIFGIRYNDQAKTDIRQTAGRFVGKGKDLQGRDAFSIVLSTREQHIRREKATSNICSNQAYIATVAGAALLERGAEGVAAAGLAGRNSAVATISRLLELPGVELAFPDAPFWNEVTLALSLPVARVLAEAAELGVHAGVDVSARSPEKNRRQLLLVSFSDLQSSADCDLLVAAFAKIFSGPKHKAPALPRVDSFIRKSRPELARFSVAELKAFYEHLGEQNVSPDDNIYALGSCTMKYNPYINDWAAALPGFSELHPEAPESDVQGALQIIYETQEYFKAITGLAGVTTQPVAGAQGELTGLKLFQAYHRDRGDLERDVMLIPRTAHGTNPATATMAGFITGTTSTGRTRGVVLVESDSSGQIDLGHLEKLVREHGRHVAGVMITNPNTSGILETNFREVARLVHQAGGLVYMDGANMNAIAGWVNLGELGVDAVHNNTHKTWTIPHGGGGPGDAFVAVSQKLVEFLPGTQVVLEAGKYRRVRALKSIGSFHRHHGNFAHKVRCYTYLRALGREGVRRMAGVAVLSANYLFQELRKDFPSLPSEANATPRMHEFILTLDRETFAKIEAVGLKKSDIIPRVGKLFLDFGLHAPTVAFPEVYGLMIEPTESYTKAELDRFIEVVRAIRALIEKYPSVLTTVPHFTPIDKVDEVQANKDLLVSEPLLSLPPIHPSRIPARELDQMPIAEISERILAAHARARN